MGLGSSGGASVEVGLLLAAGGDRPFLASGADDKLIKARLLRMCGVGVPLCCAYLNKV
jgi:hypothetical protein